MVIFIGLSDAKPDRWVGAAPLAVFREGSNEI